MIRALVGLAARSARAGRVRTTVAVVVTGLATVLLLSGLAMSSVAEDRSGVAGARLPVNGAQAPPGEGFLFESTDSYYDGAPVFGLRVAVVGAVDPPPGLTAFPGPGELVVSPRMARLLADPASTLSLRYPGEVVGTVTPAGLVGPDELVVWAGATPGQLDGAASSTGFGDAQVSAKLPSELRPAQGLLIIGFVIPLTALLATAASVGGDQRDRRLAALRLLGCTRRQVVATGCAEAAVLGIVGALLGVAAFAVLRAPLAPSVPINGGVWPGDVTVGWPLVLTMVLAVPLLGAGAAVVSLRSVTVDALGVVRRSPRPRLSRWRAVPMVVGLLLLVVAVAGGRLGWSVDERGTVIYLGMAATLVGIIAAGGLISAAAAGVVERFSRSVATQLGARQSQTAAARLARGSTGMAALVVISGVLLAFFPLLADASASARRDLVEASSEDQFVVSVGGGDPPLVGGPDNGLGATAILRRVSLVDDSGNRGTVLVGDCPQLRAAIGPGRPTCEQGVSLPQDVSEKSPLPQPPFRVLDTPLDDGLPAQDPVGPAFRLDPAPGESAYLNALSNADGLGAFAFLPSTALPDAVAAQVEASPGVLLASPDGPDLERARTALVLATGSPTVLTSGEQLAIDERTTRTFRGLTLTALGSGAAVAALSLLVAAVDNGREQRRAWTSLRVLGTPRQVWRRSRLVQGVVTTVPLLAVAALASVLAAFAFVTLADSPPPLPLTAMACTTAIAVVVSLLMLAVAGRMAATPSTVPDPAE